MNNYYFMKTVSESGRNRLRPLPGQTLPDGTRIDESMNVQADSIMRGSYPIGTVFGTESLEERRHTDTPFYSAGAIYPVGLTLGAYKTGSHIPPQDMTNAYNTWRQTHGDAARSALDSIENALFDESGNATVQPQAPQTLLEKMMTNPDYAAPTVDSDGFWVDRSTWLLLVGNIIQKENTLLIGATGTGKTELVMLAAKKLGLPCHVYDMGSMHDPISGLLGTHRLQNGRSVFDYARFTEDIQCPGVILLDELSRAPVTANNILFPVMDSRRELPVEIAGGEGLRNIKLHPDCVIIATANVGAEYTGTMSMDAALVNRLFPLELTYMPEDEEVKVLGKRCTISEGDARSIVTTAATVRSLYEKGDLSATISTRETLMAGRLVRTGWPVERALSFTFLPKFEGTDTSGERSIVKKTFMAL